MNPLKIPLRVYEDDIKASQSVARRMAGIIRDKQSRNAKAVFGLATGHTPIGVYRELIRMHREEGLSFVNVVTFNLDEYWPIDKQAAQSYNRWMNENLFNHIDIPAENINIPSGEVVEGDIEDFCRAYEQAIAEAGGIDLQILGIGRNGHIGFNEPGSERNSRTRQVRLDPITRRDAAADFFSEQFVPETAITMGIGSIMAAREICLLAFGESKASVIAQAVEGEVSSRIAASFLQDHPHATLFLDEPAAGALTPVRTPWLVERCVWDEALQRQAVIWLADKVGKPILKLTNEDYADNGLHELLHWRGGAYNSNLDVFRRMMNTITGWPGGKKGGRRILIFSPHPDDDVICMSGTMSRLVEQGHEVHTACMVSGYLAVFDHDAERHAEFVREFNAIFGLAPEQSALIEEHIERFLRQKKPGAVDSPEVQRVKALIRRTEAIAAAKFCDLEEKNVHFLDMPFYDSGSVQKLPLSDKDIRLVLNLLEQIQPEMIFAAGDMTDPHGTHRQCMEAIVKALDQYMSAGHSRPDLWFYRGAWQEWPTDQIQMAVPLSPDELKRKRFAVFRHESQKDQAMFPGSYDSREFWQRAEERNMTTARHYDKLGLPEYHAIEAFARTTVSRSRHAESHLCRD